MTTALDHDRSAKLAAEGAAANDDHVSYASAVPRLASPSATGGWDAYDVWRRLIKEARDRRAGRSFPE
jgi:hypothetical protein